MPDSEIEVFKKNFFDLPSRSFGENYMQKLFYNKYNELPYKGYEVDAYKQNISESGETFVLKGEYKSVRLLFENEKSDSSCLYDEISDNKPMSRRIASLENLKAGDVSANFQNIKCDESGRFDFDYLRFALASEEGVYVFEITCENMMSLIENGEFPNWCSKHGSKESGLNGQFTITKDNINWHMKNTFREIISWEEVISIFKSIKS